jgi:hypothetical protein
MCIAHLSPTPQPSGRVTAAPVACFPALILLLPLAAGGRFTAAPVAAFLDPFIRDTLANLMVWPARMVVPLLPQEVRAFLNVHAPASRSADTGSPVTVAWGGGSWGLVPCQAAPPTPTSSCAAGGAFRVLGWTRCAAAAAHAAASLSY